jgi:tripartite-type tricarboxylate transporter receptor subunit TctC
VATIRVSLIGRTAAVLCAALGLSAIAAPRDTAAQAFPNKPIRLIISAPAGGPRDIQARLIGPKLQDALGQPLVVDNRGGASGIIGTDLVAKAQPDGHTLLMLTLSHAVTATLYPKLPYDSINDFTYITSVTSGPGLLVVNLSVPAKTVAEFVEYVRGRPGKVFYGTAGSGTPSHLAVELLKIITRTDMVHVPYKGMAAAITDVISGQLQASIPTIPAGLQHAKAGRLRALAVTSVRRSSAAPELPTMIEAGIPGYSASNWYGMAAPAKTPRPVVMRLNKEIRAAMASADLAERFIALGLEPDTSSPEEFSAFVKSEVDKWAKVVKASGLRPD